MNKYLILFVIIFIASCKLNNSNTSKSDVNNYGNAIDSNKAKKIAFHAVLKSDLGYSRKDLRSYNSRINLSTDSSWNVFMSRKEAKFWGIGVSVAKKDGKVLQLIVLK